MLFGPFAARNEFWLEIVSCLEREPKLSIEETMDRLCQIRMVSREAAAYTRRCVPAEWSAIAQLRALQLSHEALTLAVDKTLRRIARMRSPSAQDIWAIFSKEYRITSVHAVDDLAKIFPGKLGSRVLFESLPLGTRARVVRSMAGYTPLGTALADSPAFVREVGKHFDDARVRKAGVKEGPKGSAKQFIALYSDRSPGQVHLKRKELLSKSAKF